VNVSCEKFCVKLVQAFIHTDFGESGFELVGFEGEEDGFGIEPLWYEVKLLAFVEKVNLRFDCTNILKMFPNTTVHPASGK
jgi:hypothetical protein